MRSRILLLSLFVLCLGFASLIFAQSFETIEIGKGGPPKWSPDGTKLAFMSEGWLCIADADGKGQILKITDKVNPHIFEWISDSEFVVWEIERTETKDKRTMIGRMKTVTLDGSVAQIAEDKVADKQEPNISGLTILEDGTVGYYEGRFSLPEKDKIFKVIRQGKQKLADAERHWKVDFYQRGPGSEIYLRTVDGKEEKRIPNPKGYDCLQLSPDGSRILAVDIQGPLYGIWILDLEGKPLVKLAGSADKEDRVQLTPGVFGWADGSTARWSPDGQKIAYLASAQDEYNIIASKIFVVNSDGTGRTRLTSTSNEIECNPEWSPDGTRIAYTGYNSHKIYVAKLK